MSPQVSSGRPKSGPPAHANRHAFKHNPSSKLTKQILASPISSTLCPGCVEVIEWRKRYRKYKPLTVAKRCARCGEGRAVKEAYHVICGDCARGGSELKSSNSSGAVCAKCLEPRSLDAAKAQRKGLPPPPTEDFEDDDESVTED